MTLTTVLRRHPFPMAAHLRHSLVLAWALPHQVIQAQLPRGLVVDRYGDVGFVAAAMVQAERLRPAGAPAWLGDDPFLVGWRIFARHAGPDGRRRRGLFILRSDTDRRALVAGGNLLTRYNWRRSAIAAEVGGGRMTVRVTSAGGLADARRFAGPLPWTFDHEPETGSMVLVLGRRSQWRPEPVDVRVERCTFFDHGPLAGTRPVLANAFHVAGLDYRWERGIRVPAVQAVTS